MNNLSMYTDQFFKDLEMFEDIERGHNFKPFIHTAIQQFLEKESKESAFAVYVAFFSSYRITLEEDENRFIDLLDVLRQYEENASTLIDRQRDHYTHSVNVFILGLCIYTHNRNFRTAFNAAVMDKRQYPNSYDTKNEEFFYRWGIASLFHDVGYPIEIISKQLQKFLDFVSGVGKAGKLKSRLVLENFDTLNAIEEVIPRVDFTSAYRERFPSTAALDLLKPVDLLAHKLHLSLNLNLNTLKVKLDGFVDTMAENGFIDHGFYSAILVLKWYGYLVQSCAYKPDYFFYPVLDSASAILLHNYYKNVIMKAPFEKGPLSPIAHPIAFLLIFCDELQEWDRQGYGVLDRKRAAAGDISIQISDDRMNLTYIAEVGRLPDEFKNKKMEVLHKLLDMGALFPNGFSIGSESVSELSILAGGIKILPDSDVRPRPLLENIEKLAIEIHNYYNQISLKRKPAEPLVYPNFSDLPDSLKYSNLRQAMGIAEKLEMLNAEIRPIGSSGKIIEKIAEKLVEELSILEHNRWMEERLAAGWKYGEHNDTQKKISPYLIPYDQLSEEVKEKDRDFIRNIPSLLNKIGMAAYSR